MVKESRATIAVPKRGFESVEASIVDHVPVPYATADLSTNFFTIHGRLRRLRREYCSIVLYTLPNASGMVRTVYTLPL